MALADAWICTVIRVGAAAPAQGWKTRDLLRLVLNPTPGTETVFVEGSKQVRSGRGEKKKERKEEKSV